MQVRDDPDVREVGEVLEAAAMRLEDLDARVALFVGDRLERHAVEIRVRRRHDANRAVDDWVDCPSVEERLDERERRANDGEPPEDERPVERRHRAQLALEDELPADEERGLVVEQSGGVRAGAVVEEELQHELGAQVTDVLHRRVAPAPEGGAAATRRCERRTSRAFVARCRSLDLHEPGLAQLSERPVHERARARVDATHFAVRREHASDRPAVPRPLAEKPERSPLGQGRLGAGGTAHGLVNK